MYKYRQIVRYRYKLKKKRSVRNHTKYKVRLNKFLNRSQYGTSAQLNTGAGNVISFEETISFFRGCRPVI
jgi:hypothetical protein